MERLEPRHLFAAGDLDAGFGVNGLLIDPIPANYYFVNDTVALPGVQFLVAGNIDAGSDGFGGFLRRYTADGAIDPTFGDEGTVISRLDADGGGFVRIKIVGDGKIVALLQGPNGTETQTHYLIARFNADGTPDTGFAGDGVLDAGLRPYEVGFGVQPDGAPLIVSGDTVTRYTAAGAIDTSFGDDGTTQHVLTGPAVVVQPLAGGKILIAGRSDGKFGITRLNADGSIDSTFGDNGVTITDLAGDATVNRDNQYIKSLALLPDGGILVTGDAVNGGAVVRYLPDGTLDASFGDNGVSVLPTWQQNDVFTDPAGRIYTIGFDALVTRLTRDGDIDPAFGRIFGPGGPEHTLLQNRNGILLSNGRLVVPGAYGGWGAPNLALVARLTDDDGQPSPIRFSDGVISITGTAADDQIVIRDAGFSFDARLGDFGRLVTKGEVNFITASGLAGKDVIDMSEVDSVSVSVSGGTERDRIAGGQRRDTLEGNAGHDFIDGGAGADVISGGAGNDSIRGQAGSDHLYGRAGDDYVEGNGGNDRIDGAAGTDSLHGNGGNDFLLAGDGAADFVFGDGGADAAVADHDDLLTSIEQP